VPARTQSRGARRASLVAVALALVASGCSVGGGDDTPDAVDETPTAETGPDVDALRAAWSEEIGAACAERAEQVETLARDLPSVVEQGGLSAAADQLASAEETFLATVSAADPAPGDEAQAEEMAALYEESGDSRIRALRARYSKRDRTFYELMDRSESAGEEAGAIAAELGAESCAGDPPGPYSTVDGLAAVRWGERASTLCSERDRAYMRLRPTDAARFEAVTRRWLRQMRALEPPDEYAREIERFLDLYVASSQAQRDAEAAFDRGDIAAGERLNDKGNRLITKSTEVMYDVGFAIGFERFCSARPA
jgi:hypothetical protein